MAVEHNRVSVITPTTAVVSNAASSTILAANPRRLFASIINASANGIYLGFGAPAVVGQGVYIGPNGFGWSIDPSFDWRGTVTAIAVAGAANTVAILDAQ